MPLGCVACRTQSSLKNVATHNLLSAKVWGGFYISWGWTSLSDPNKYEIIKIEGIPPIRAGAGTGD